MPKSEAQAVAHFIKARTLRGAAREAELAAAKKAEGFYGEVRCAIDHWPAP